MGVYHYCATIYFGSIGQQTREIGTNVTFLGITQCSYLSKSKWVPCIPPRAIMGTNCEACQGKHRAHTCKVVRRTTRGRTRRSPLEAVENALSFCAPGSRMLCMSCELCLAKDRKIAALELRLRAYFIVARQIWAIFTVAQQIWAFFSLARQIWG